MELLRLVVLLLCLLNLCMAVVKDKNKDKNKNKHTTIKPFFGNAEAEWIKPKGKNRDTAQKKPTTIKPFFPDAEAPWMRSGHDGLIPNTSGIIPPIFFGQNYSSYLEAGVRVLRLGQFVLPMVTPLETSSISQDPHPQVDKDVKATLSGGNNKRNSHLSKDMERNKLAARPLMCGDYYLVPGERISLMSPYFPVKYPNNFRCRWNLQTATDASFVVNCNFFKLARGDSFSTYEIGKISTLKKFTWSQGPKNYHMNNYFIRLIFISDKKLNNNGFSCQVQAKPKDTPTTTPAIEIITSLPPTEVEELSTTIAIGTTEAITTPEPETETKKPDTTKPQTTAPPKTESPAPTEPPPTEPPQLSDPECGIVNRAVNRIVNGQFADLHEYPWMAYLEIRWDDGHNQLCGGSLVFDQWVLTAAHCVLRERDDGSQWVPEVKVSLAMTRRSQPTSDGAFTVTATDVKIHPKLSFSHDVTLIKLPSPVAYSDAVRPVCLPNRFMHGRNYTGMVMALAGWGKTQHGEISDRLRELGRYGIESAICQKVFGQYITEHHFCTSGVDIKHICLGDSGGPVMTVEKGNRFFLTGVVSFVATKDCLGEFPDGHTSVSHFLDWIETATGKVIH